MILGLAALPVADVLPGSGASAAAPPGPDIAAVPFDASTVPGLARALAAKPFQPQDTGLPPELQNLKYDQYRNIRFDTAKALWRGQGLNFAVQFFHRGFIYTGRVDIYEVAEAQAKPIRYTPDLFHFDHGVPRPKTDNLGFAGFRIHAPINRPDYYDEVSAFLGASYFRAVAKGQGYGLSARGLAIKTADPTGEEFPVFKSFWLERPEPGAKSLTIWALLDSQSAAGSFRFVITPGDETVFDTEMTLFPRAALAEAGIAPLTSMFWFDASDRAGIDDFRSAVHDSDGLLMRTGHGDQLWRPVANPRALQFSAFSDDNPNGFGLLQRERSFSDYQDLESHYELRPSAWVEPQGNWGEGSVDLVEIPTSQEVHDNIVTFWRPKAPLAQMQQFTCKYRLHWCRQPPVPDTLAHVAQTRAGAGFDEATRLFVIDFIGDALKTIPTDAKLTAEISASKGKILHPIAQKNSATGGWRISFELAPGNEKLVELRARLVGEDAPVSEFWVYRWTT